MLQFLKLTPHLCLLTSLFKWEMRPSNLFKTDRVLLWNTEPTYKQFLSVCVFVCLATHIPQSTTQHTSAWATFCHLVYMYRITALAHLPMQLFISFYPPISNPWANMLSCLLLSKFFFSMHIRSCFIIIMQCFRARVDEALNHPLHASVFDAPYRSAMVTLPLVTVLKKKSGGDWCRVAREWQCYISVYLSTRLSPSFAAVLTSHPI